MASIIPPPSLEELISRILEGEVIFFVGAGFSVDSEGLTAAVVMKRLLLRLRAFDRIQPQAKDSHFVRFTKMFGLSENLRDIAASENFSKKANEEKPSPRAKSQIDQLATRYYEVNAALCSAFGNLFLNAARASSPNSLADLGQEEAAARTESGWEGPRYHFQAIDSDWIKKASSAVTEDERPYFGKLIFAQSVGLFDDNIMAGRHYNLGKSEADLDNFEASYKGRLLPRHHVLARLAREGLCTTCLTTNFDLLIEGAFQLSGFKTAGCERNKAVESSLPRFDVIASPKDFFTRGKAFQTATVVKLHGCAGKLRSQRKEATELKSYLPQLVYTYREIQNWRDDTWAADYLKTLLRTRTFVLSGYSAADPVMHDTFRSIYEEMERKLAAASSGPPPPANNSQDPQLPEAPSGQSTRCPNDRTSDGQNKETRSSKAPAYFFAYSPTNSEDIEFHAHEVLHASSRAVGEQPSGNEHPQYLRFAPSWETNPGNFTQDEILLWIQHRVLRMQQASALEAELPALYYRLSGKKASTAEVKRISEAFNHLQKFEGKSIFEAADVAGARRAFRETCAWSFGFHSALRRQWAHASALLRVPAQLAAFRELRSRHWYYPASERPAWTAWSAVLELALRSLNPDGGQVEATHAEQPTVFLPTGRARCNALTIEVRNLAHRLSPTPKVPGVPARQIVWRMRDEDAPWSSDSGSRSSRDPAAPPQDQAESGSSSAAQVNRKHRVVRGNTTWLALPPVGEVWNLALTPGRAKKFLERYGA